MMTHHGRRAVQGKNLDIIEDKQGGECHVCASMELGLLVVVVILHVEKGGRVRRAVGRITFAMFNLGLVVPELGVVCRKGMGDSRHGWEAYGEDGGVVAG